MYQPIQNVRVALPGLLASALTTVTVIWPRPMPDKNYCVQISVFNPSALAMAQNVVSFDENGAVIKVQNMGLTALATGTATLHVTAVHD